MIRYKIFLLLVLAAFLSGCRKGEEPRLRISSYFGAVNGIRCADPCDLGHHNYLTKYEEKSGLVYTCKAGFIDLGHVREAADRTAYVYHLIYKKLMAGSTQFEFRVIEPSRYRLSLLYPSDWQNRTEIQRRPIAREVAIKLGQDIAHISLIWHEMITWYGFATTGLFSERISSFSWEDTYSDALGTNIAVEALRQERPYDEAVTDLLYAALRQLDAQPPAVTQKALGKIEGKWYEGGMYFFVKMHKRNFDTGFESGQVTPWLVPDICACTEPQPCIIPRPQKEELCGFTSELLLEPVVMEKSKIYSALGLKGNPPLCPAEHFPVLLAHILEQAKQQYGDDVNYPQTHRQAVAGDRIRSENGVNNAAY